MFLRPYVSVKQILPPLIVGAAHQAHDVAAGVEVEGAGFAHQLHAGFGGRLISLAAIAGWQQATRFSQVDEPPRERGMTWSSVSSPEAEQWRNTGRCSVAQQDIFARKRAALMRNAAVLEQTNHRRQTHSHAGRVQEVSILFFGHSHALEDEHEGAARGADIDRFVRSVQHQDGREQSMAIPERCGAAARTGRRRPGSCRRVPSGKT